MVAVAVVAVPVAVAVLGSRSGPCKVFSWRVTRSLIASISYVSCCSYYRADSSYQEEWERGKGKGEKTDLRLYVLPQKRHSNGFSSVWARKCRLRCSRRLKDLEQREQANGLSSPSTRPVGDAMARKVDNKSQDWKGAK